MRTLHSLLDLNNDGLLSYDDFQVLAENFVSLGHLESDAEKEFRECLKTIWEKLFGEINCYNLVNAEQYLTEMHHAVNDKSQRDRIHAFLPYLFKVCIYFLFIIGHFKVRYAAPLHFVLEFA